MAERYSKLYTLPLNLYLPASPVLIAAGALLKDNQTGKLLCQLKYKNIGDRPISALKVLVLGYDMSQEEVCRREYQYLDLKIPRNGVFGAKEAIPLPERSVRSYSACVTAVFFTDGGSWTAEETRWESLPSQEPLRSRLFDRELIRQYKLDSSDSSEYVPCEHEDLWFCACGEINHPGELCCSCGQDFYYLQQLLDVELLLEKKNARLMEEAKQAAELESHRQHSGKVLKRVLMVIIPLLLVSAAAGFVMTRSQQRQADYDMAGVLMEAQRYTEAAKAYDELGNYKDSARKAEQARAVINEMNAYDKACKFLDNERYDDAYNAFTAMGDYLDAPLQAKKALYLKALKLAKSGDCEDARELFLQLGSYEDSARLSQSFCELLVLEETSYDPECEGPLSTEYVYDENGVLMSKISRYSVYPGMHDRVLQYAWNGDGSYTLTEGSIKREYDAWGVLLSTNGVKSYEYDYGYYDSGSLYYVGAYTEDMSFVSETVYDEQGNVIRFTDVDGKAYETRNEYDENGRLKLKENFDAEGAFVDRTSYEYDGNGNLRRSTYMDLNNVTSVTNFSYELKFVPQL